jgi:hypothetical protein
MNDKTYEDGILEGEIKSLQHDMNIIKTDVHELKLDTKSQSKLQNMLLGAIFLAQFIIPILAKLWK